jgi:predicted nucleotidyltransferase
MAANSSAICHAVKKYVQGLESIGVRVQQVFLYGSHAKNTVHADSDIDIIIVSEKFVGKNLLERLQILAKGMRNLSDPIEAYGFTPEEVENRERDLSAFWEEIIDTEAIPLTDKVLTSQKKKKPTKRRKPALLRQ